MWNLPKIRWIATINNHTSFNNNINCFKLYRTVCASYDKVTLLQTFISKLLAFLPMCMHMSCPKGHVGPVLPSPWFKALYFFWVVTHFVQDKNFKGTVPFSNLKAMSIIFVTGRKKRINVCGKERVCKTCVKCLGNNLKHRVQSISKKIHSTLSLKTDTKKNATSLFKRR